MDKNVRIFVLHPTTDFVRRDSIHFVQDYNNGSVVLRIQYGKTGILLTGDAEEPSELQMVQLFDRFLQSSFVKVGHHGSVTSSTPQFVEAMRPDHAAISVGANNKFGHPSMEVIARYQSVGTEVRRTDLEGALIYESDGRSVRRLRWR